MVEVMEEYDVYRVRRKSGGKLIFTESLAPSVVRSDSFSASHSLTASRLFVESRSMDRNSNSG
jgi:hypothetical protein